MIQNSITKLIQYGLETGLIEKEDTRYAANKVLELLKIDSLDADAEQAMADYVPGSSEVVGELECILGEICDYSLRKRAFWKKIPLATADLFVRR